MGALSPTDPQRMGLLRARGGNGGLPGKERRGGGGTDGPLMGCGTGRDRVVAGAAPESARPESRTNRFQLCSFSGT